MTDDEYKCAYRKGYNRACSRSHSWPEHRPPHPPEEIVARLFKAAQQLRDTVDGELAKFDEDDELNKIIGPKIDDLDNVFVEIAKWLKQEPAA